jgi:hypothetical protein
VITKKLIAMLDTHAADLSSSWVKMVRENENIHVYKTLDDDILANRADFIYEQLKTWLDWQTTSKEVARLFWEMGTERRIQNVPFSEVLYSSILARRNLYINILEKIHDEENVNMQEVIAFTSRITYFFDKVAYFLSKGYEGEEEPAEEDEAALDRILTAFRAGETLSK